MKKIIDFLKKHYLIEFCILSFVLLVFVFPRLERRGTFGLTDNEYVTLACPNGKVAGQTFDCNIILKNTGKKILSINANYDLGDLITYQSISINSDSGFELYSVDENENESDKGFAVVNLNGVTAETIIGSVTFMMGSEAEANRINKVGIKSIELVTDVLLEDGSYEMLTADDYATQVKTFNNVATLSNLEVTEGSLDKAFNSDVTDYTVNVSNEITTIRITPTTTDENATVSGNGIIPTLNLHYGTNSYTIIVTAEDGVTTKTYNVDVYRQYEFSTDVYVYNETNNYLFTGPDNNNMIINNLEKLSDGLQYNINGDNLEVLNGEEVLASIKIVNFTSAYTIVNKIIYIPSSATYGDIKQNITSDDGTIKVVDSEDVELTDTETVIDQSEYKLYFYYGDTKVGTYTFSDDDYLRINDLIYDNNLMMIKRLVAGMTYDELKNHFETSGTITITSAKGTANDSDIVKTGDTLTITLSDYTYNYKLSVLGDNNGDGIIEVIDVGRLYKYYNNKLEFTAEQIAAGDITGDGVIEIIDVGRLYKFYNKKIPVLEVGGK